MKNLWNELFSVWVLLLVVLLWSMTSHAADYSVKFGPSIQNGSTDGSSKTFGFRREELIADGISYAAEVGGYVDNGPDRNGSGLLKLQMGVTPGAKEGLFAKAFFGPCAITTPDSQLSSWYEFSTDIGIGVRDKDTFMSIGYNHISNAGLKLPNHGRDALLFEAGVRFD